MSLHHSISKSPFHVRPLPALWPQTVVALYCLSVCPSWSLLTGVEKCLVIDELSGDHTSVQLSCIDFKALLQVQTSPNAALNSKR